MRAEPESILRHRPAHSSANQLTVVNDPVRASASGVSIGCNDLMLSIVNESDPGVAPSMTTYEKRPFFEIALWPVVVVPLMAIGVTASPSFRSTNDTMPGLPRSATMRVLPTVVILDCIGLSADRYFALNG